MAESIRHFYSIYQNGTGEGKTAIIQGWGNVASTAASYLTLQGVRIIGIIDRVGGVIRPEGMGVEEVKSLFVSKAGNQLQAPDFLPFEEVNERIWKLGADIFVPGAASKLVTPEQVEAMLAGGLEVIACGANVPFVDDGIFFGPTAMKLDQKISLLPDFIANCGMARVFAYLMKANAEMTDQAIFGDVSQTIRRALEEVHMYRSEPTRIASTSLEIALNKLLPEVDAEIALS